MVNPFKCFQFHGKKMTAEDKFMTRRPKTVLQDVIKFATIILNNPSPQLREESADLEGIGR